MQSKILIINYYWPPCGGPAVQRWLNFTRYLPQHGIKPYVLTVDPEKAAFPSVDDSLLRLVVPEVDVTHTDTAVGVFEAYKKTLGKGQIPSTNLANEPKPGLLQKAARFVRGNFFLPDPRRGWNRYALPEARRLIREHSIRIIATAGPPHSTHLIGRTLKRENPELKWLADLHDYWTDSSYVHKFYRTALAHRIDLGYELSVLREADHVTNDCQMGCDRLWQKVSDRDRADFTGISMGYDEELFPPSEPKPQKEFRITFTGTMTDNFHAGVFFRTLRQVWEQYPKLPLRLCFVGLLGQAVREEIQQHKLGEALETPGYVSHEEAIRYLYQSSVLFLITPRFSGEKYHIPGKLYEYLATRKPILCIAPHESETAHILDRCQAGVNAERDEPEVIKKALIAWIKAWQSAKTIDLNHKNERFARYSRRNETKRLAALIHQLEVQTAI